MMAVQFFDLAAAYCFGMAKNHPFVDGNKRDAFLAGTLFLEINGYEFHAQETESAIVFEKLAAGEVDEIQLASWLKRNCS